MRWIRMIVDFRILADGSSGLAVHRPGDSAD